MIPTQGWGADTSVPREWFDLWGDDEEEDAKGTDGQTGLQAESTSDCNLVHTDPIFTFRPDLQTHTKTGHKQTCKAEPTLLLSATPQNLLTWAPRAAQRLGRGCKNLPVKPGQCTSWHTGDWGSKITGTR